MHNKEYYTPKTEDFKEGFEYQWRLSIGCKSEWKTEVYKDNDDSSFEFSNCSGGGSVGKKHVFEGIREGKDPHYFGIEFRVKNKDYQAPKIEDYGKLSQDISNWIKEYALSNKIDTLHVGVSGGIDSAVVSTLCAMTGLPTFAYSLPINSHSDNNYNAQLQLSFLKKSFPKNVNTSVIDLSKKYEAFIDNLHASDLTKANTKSRLRMVFLYAKAGDSNGIVVGTGNYQEDGICHFFTKYGDGGVDISPIGDLLKSQVRQLGRYLGVPEQILTSKPTDGLWDDNRTDESQLSCTYEEIEEILPYLHSAFLPNHLTHRNLEVLGICKFLYEKGKHKTNSIPVFKVDKEKYQEKTAEYIIP